MEKANRVVIVFTLTPWILSQVLCDYKYNSGARVLNWIIWTDNKSNYEDDIWVNTFIQITKLICS